MLTAVGRVARRWVAPDPWTNVYGLARTLLALGTGLTLLINRTETLFRPATGLPDCPFCSGPSQIGLFCLVPKDRLELARWLAVAILAVVASGWRPRITGILHWWVAFSLQASAVAIDGGDQVTAILALLLMPVTLTDGRRWHWTSPVAPPATPPAVPPAALPATPRGSPGDERRRLVAWSALWVIRIQVAGIYFHSAVGKLGVREWVDGTVLYYWLTDPAFGAPGWLRPILMPVLTHAATVFLLTWTVLLLEVFLSMALVMPKKARGGFLVAGIAFHVGIAVVHGLISFALAMIGALVLYLRPPDRAFRPEPPRTPRWLRFEELPPAESASLPCS